MTPEIEAEYQRMLARAVLKHGLLARESSTLLFEWRDYERTWNDEPPHLSTCPAVETGEVEETCWPEFNGTFCEDDNSVHGVRLAGVTCACGHIKNRELRWSASVQEVARAVFEELYRTSRPRHRVINRSG